MTYDKETGDVHIHDPSEDIKEKKIITNIDEVFQMKDKLRKELGLGNDGLPLDANEDADNIDIHKLSEKL